MLEFFRGEPGLNRRKLPKITRQTGFEKGTRLVAQAFDGDDNGDVRGDQSQEGVGRRRGREARAKRARAA
jgi:hypothetical protein